MNQGTITVDWDGKGGMLITYPDGKLMTASNKKQALHLIKIWCQQLTDIVSSVSGHPTISSARIEWMNGTNYT